MLQDTQIVLPCSRRSGKMQGHLVVYCEPNESHSSLEFGRHLRALIGNMAVARPCPVPSPAFWPAPVTFATFPGKRIIPSRLLACWNPLAFPKPS
jgi:hypothetical protein